VAGITRRVGAWVRPPGRRHLTVFAALTGASQTEALLSVLGSVVLVRAEGAETAGRVFFAQAAAALWFTFADPKLDDAIQRFVPQEQAAGRGRGSALFDRLLRLDALAGSAGTAAGMLGTLFAAGAGWLDAGQAWLLLLALAAARALTDTDLHAEKSARRAMAIAADICVYTNRSLTLETIEG